MPHQFTDSPTWAHLHFQTSDECHLVPKNDSFMSFYLISLTTWPFYPDFPMFTQISQLQYSVTDASQITWTAFTFGFGSTSQYIL